MIVMFILAEVCAVSYIVYRAMSAWRNAKKDNNSTFARIVDEFLRDE